ncbi:uncharacterized protein BDZ99DRAFT_431836 [Mytilinidion resinicola]|uniref:C2H2-type domain-containing protein n=1 Tax=Mytilinidion resinicola TaxID=574789 RepID=A0A6A6Z9C8_9PEZI|nr:uncharacterized protein BDZ99DRAFT_431836 [Mytilinidion resinicola]KAF2817616.1 hypothetical protein BDZ99DRAFT_431836 [Mytilinidion resinicola]
MSENVPTAQGPQSATTPQQQPQVLPQPQGQASPAVASGAGDQLVCQWQNCGERCPSAEQLYDHVCERHVGRKSTNNLNLTCQWGNCRTTTVKRDHITSHIRVHVPLKPHKCDFCGKAFKRPQDLKKHVKTHADDSVLLHSPEPGRAGHGGGNYQQNNGKLVADLQALAATASGYYNPENPGSGNYGQQHQGGQPPQGFYSAAPQSTAYGPVYYAVNQPQSMNNDSYEIRKRAAYDALNEFFGDAKRRLIDPTTYYDVGQRLMGLQGVQLPVVAGGGGGGYQGGMSDYGQGGPMVAHAPAPPSGHQYSLPLPNLRTKNDILNIDQFLEQLQSTVYENSNHAAAAGVVQPGAHYMHPGINYRSSNSPPGMPAGSHPQSSHATAVAPMSAAPASETPALTPASSVLSYNSAHSPGSGHSGSTVSPTSRAGMSSMYPTLPSVSTMSDASNYPATSGAPPSALGASFDADGRRRYSGHLLQKAAPSRRSSDDMDISEEGSPKGSRRGSEQDSLRHNVNQLAIQSPKVDPALRSPSQASSGEPVAESWVENIRTIEKLRSWLKERIEQHDYVDDEDSTPEADSKPSMSEDAHNLYPVLRAVREGTE